MRLSCSANSTISPLTASGSTLSTAHRERCVCVCVYWGGDLPFHCSLSSTLTISMVTEHRVLGHSGLRLEKMKEMALSVFTQ